MRPSLALGTEFRRPGRRGHHSKQVSRTAGTCQAKYPILRAVEALGVLVTVWLLIFSLASSINDPGAFSADLDQTAAG